PAIHRSVCPAASPRGEPWGGAIRGPRRARGLRTGAAFPVAGGVAGVPDAGTGRSGPGAVGGGVTPSVARETAGAFSPLSGTAPAAATPGRLVCAPAVADSLGSQTISKGDFSCPLGAFPSARPLRGWRTVSRRYHSRKSWPR